MRENQDLKLIQRIEESDEMDLLFEVLGMSHPELESSA